MNHKEAGFSLIELITIIAVLAIMVAIALPSFGAMLQKAEASSTSQLLTTSFSAARFRAVTDNAPVTVCPSVDGRTCRGDADWSDGWILYRDPGHDRQPRTGDAVVQRIERMSGELLVRSTAGRTHVRFLPSGWAFGSNLSVRLCRRGENGFLGSVIVNNAGRPRTERPASPMPCPFSVGAI